jgi:hypothetical protein
MSFQSWWLLGCLVCILATIPFTTFWLRRAAQYNRITVKLRAGEKLTEREHELMERASER